ncbi:substrate-binding periplasmic protein [Roseospira navarrensis]|nr:transporter substrate-binding domain-containing protein [Roseospira navarrensis]
MIALWPAVVLAQTRSASPGDPVAEPLTLLVFERPPYYLPDGTGGFTGLVAGPVAEAMARAGIPVRWKTLQPNGHLRTVATDSGPVCAVGWYRSERREHLGLFSDPIYREPSQVVLARTDNDRVLSQESLQDLFADSGVRLGTKLGYSYGPRIDGMIETLRPPQSTVSQDDTGLVRMLLGRRFDYMLTGRAEAEDLIDRFGAAGQDLIALTFEDSPQGNARHLVCSRSVGADTMARFNAALADIGRGTP